MSAVYNPEAETMGEIERLEIEARDLRRRLKCAGQAQDQQVLQRQVRELEEQIAILQARLP